MFGAKQGKADGPPRVELGENRFEQPLLLGKVSKKEFEAYYRLEAEKAERERKEAEKRVTRSSEYEGGTNVRQTEG